VDVKKLLELYERERDYQRCIFGSYENLKFLNLASFLLLIEKYIQKAKESYNGPWKHNDTAWLESCEELQNNLAAPIETYENLIKIMALTGAALETYAEINPNFWRVNPLAEGARWLETKNEEWGEDKHE
jgi:hypothetical protein